MLVGVGDDVLVAVKVGDAVAMDVTTTADVAAAGGAVLVARVAAICVTALVARRVAACVAAGVTGLAVTGRVAVPVAVAFTVAGLTLTVAIVAATVAAVVVAGSVLTLVATWLVPIGEGSIPTAVSVGASGVESSARKHPASISRINTHSASRTRDRVTLSALSADRVNHRNCNRR